MAEITKSLDISRLPLSDGDNSITVTSISTGIEESLPSVETIYTAGGITYKLSDTNDYYTITAVDASCPSNVEIQPTYNGLPVKAIGASAFSGSHITSIIIPNTVTSIGENAFNACASLASVTLIDAETLTVYFCNNYNWTDVRCYYWGEGDVVSGSSRGDKMTYVGDDSNGNQIYSFEIPIAATGVIFNGLNGSGSNEQTPSIETDIKHGVCWTINYDSEGDYAEIYSYTPSGDNSLKIGKNAFKDCEALTGINISNFVSLIGDYAFSSCGALESLTFSQNCRLKTIGSSAFMGSEFTSISLPEGLEEIGNFAFASCGSLVDVTYPVSLKKIGNSTFQYCSEIETFECVSNNSKLESIGVSAFTNCGSLKVFTIGEHVTSIGSSAFIGCEGLTDIIFSDLYGWFYIAGGSASVPEYPGDGTHIIASSLSVSSSNVTLLKSTYSGNNLYKIEQMPAPTASIENKILTMTDITGIAEHFKIYINGTHKATFNVSDNTLDLV